MPTDNFRDVVVEQPFRSWLWYYHKAEIRNRSQSFKIQAPNIKGALSLLFALFGEESLQQSAAFRFTHAAGDFAPMIQRGKLQQV